MAGEGGDVGEVGALEINLRSSCDLSHDDGGDQRRRKCVKVHGVGLISVAGVKEEEEEEEGVGTGEGGEEAGPMPFACRAWPAGGAERKQLLSSCCLSVRPSVRPLVDSSRKEGGREAEGWRDGGRG